MKNKLLAWTASMISISFLFFPNSVGAEIVKNQQSKDNEVYTISKADIKVYHIKDKDVVAIPVDFTIKTSAVKDVKSFTVKPKFNNITNGRSSEVIVSNVKLSDSAKQDEELLNKIKGKFVKNISILQSEKNQIKLKININENSKLNIFPVKSRYVNQDDGTTKFRTYLVIDASVKQDSGSKLIVIDPGHGGKDPGAIDNFMYEEKINLDIGLRLNKLFNENGYITYMTRSKDITTSLQDRADAANILKADLFISIHNNSVPLDLSKDAVKIYRGTTVLYNSNSPAQESKEIAVRLLKDITTDLHTNISPVQDRGNLRVLNSTWGPAVLIEVAMMCDNSDARMLSNRIYRQKAAESIFNSINQFFKN